MIDVRLLTENEVIENETKLKHFMYMVLSENLNYDITDDICSKYYQDMKTFIKDGTAILIGAFDGQILVGFHWAYVREIFGERRMHSYHNAIEPEYRGQGIGKLFWDLLDAETRRRGINTIEAMCTYSNQVAVNYHLKHGFEIERLQVVKKL